MYALAAACFACEAGGAPEKIAMAHGLTIPSKTPFIDGMSHDVPPFMVSSRQLNNFQNASCRVIIVS